MPYTLAHPAAILPLKKLTPRWLNFSALVVGSIVPDVSYAWPRRNLDVFAHSFIGGFEFCLPVGIGLLVLFYWTRAKLILLTPRHQRLALQPLCQNKIGSPIAILLSLFIGIWTHQLWDDCTHQNGWIVLREHRWLMIILFVFKGHAFFTCHLLLYLSSFAGVAWLAYAYEQWRINVTTPPGVKPHCASLPYALLMGLLVLPIEAYHHLSHGTTPMVVVGLISLLLVAGVLFKNKNVQPILELEAARERILARLPKPAVEPLPLAEAHNRILAEEIYAPLNLPAFDNSAMDGYAVRAADISQATAEIPAQLKLIGRVAAGEIFSGHVNTGECVRIFTGSALPAGADTVVMQEDCRVAAQASEVIKVLEPAKPWENVRFRGEDFKTGATLGLPGAKLTAARLSLLAAAGRETVNVARAPVVGLLATGSELIVAGKPLAPGKIYESNRIGLSALTRPTGALTRIFPLVADSPAATRAALETAFAECDLIITSGGVSVGEMDFIKSAFVEIGGQLDFWKVAIRPGRPFVFGEWRNKFLFGLPGNPVSAFVTFLLLVRPALLRWQGADEITLPVSVATLIEPVANPGDRRHFVRVHLNDAGEARLAGMQSSHLLTSLAAANGLVDLPAGSKFAAGTAVKVLRWE